jgi:hypothetical protein
MFYYYILMIRYCDMCHTFYKIKKALFNLENRAE